jgi:hypothetical protein
MTLPAWAIKALLLLAVLAALSALVFGLDHLGHTRGRAEALAEAAEAQGRVIAAAVRDQARRQGLSNGVETRAVQVKTRIETQFLPIDREVIRYVETHAAVDACALDADGVRLWNAANRGELAGGAAAHDDAPLRLTASLAANREPGRAAGQPRGGDEGVPRLRGGQPSQGGLDQPSGTEIAGPR